MMPSLHPFQQHILRQGLACGRLYFSYRTIFHGVRQSRVSFSSSSSSSSSSIHLKEPIQDPSQYVAGTTMERLLSDPELANYMKANFPKIYDPDYVEGGLDVWAGIDPRLMEIIKVEEVAQREKRKMQLAKREESKTIYPLNMRPLQAYWRDRDTESNSRRSKFIRQNENMIPGMLLGSDPRLGIFSVHRETSEISLKTPHNLIQRELDRYYRNFVDSRVYKLQLFRDETDLEGTIHEVVPKNVNWHPLLREVYCVNFVRYHPGRVLLIPLKYINEEDSPGLKRECFIIPITRKVPVLVDEGVDIPDVLELDCTGLQVRDVIRRDRILLPQGVQFGKQVLQRSLKDYVIGKVEGRSRDFDPDAETTDKAAPATTTTTDTKSANKK